MATSDEIWMEEALRLAVHAHAQGEVPVGAVVVLDGQIIGRGWNQVITAEDATAHAEMVALREACVAVSNYRLSGCEMFVTLEPCAMCAGAVVHARLERLVIGANDPKAGAVGSALEVINHPSLNHKIVVTRGVLAGRSMDILQSFFRDKRAMQ